MCRIIPPQPINETSPVLCAFNRCKGEDLEVTTMAAKDTIGENRAMDLPVEKERWIQKYAVRILIRFQQWQTPLGVTHNYLARLKEDLVAFYDDPLKRMFVEASY